MQQYNSYDYSSYKNIASNIEFIKYFLTGNNNGYSMISVQFTEDQKTKCGRVYK